MGSTTQLTRKQPEGLEGWRMTNTARRIEFFIAVNAIAFMPLFIAFVATA
jgi:hypothetical protein